MRGPVSMSVTAFIFVALLPAAAAPQATVVPEPADLRRDVGGVPHRIHVPSAPRGGVIVAIPRVAGLAAEPASCGQGTSDEGRAVPVALPARGADVERRLRVRLVTNGHLAAGEVEDLYREVERIWTASGVHVDWHESSRFDDPREAAQVVVVLVAGGASARLASLHTIRWSAENEFPSRRPDAMVRVLTTAVWELALVSFREELYDVRLRRALRMLPILIGRVVAHELGHYLLQSREHTATGLMKQAFTSHDVLRGSREFSLHESQRVRLWSLWTEREAARGHAPRTEHQARSATAFGGRLACTSHDP